MATPARQVTKDPDAGFPVMPAVDFLQLREACGTQMEVAVELMTSRKSLGRWERGERPVPGIAAAAIRLLAAEAARRAKRTRKAIADIAAAPVEGA